MLYAGSRKATTSKVKPANLFRYPRFLIYMLGMSAFINIGRQICLVAQRIPILVWLVRKIAQLDKRFEIFSPYRPTS